MSRLRIDLDEQTVFDGDVLDASLNVDRNWEKLVSDPLMAAAFAGAPPSALAKLPGRMVAYADNGSEITLTFRFRTPGGSISEFRPESF